MDDENCNENPKEKPKNIKICAISLKKRNENKNHNKNHMKTREGKKFNEMKT